MTMPLADTYSTNTPGPSQDDGDASRQRRGLVIAATVSLKRNRMGWTVPSQSGNGAYHTTTDFCSCPDYESRARPCKHMYAVRFVSAIEGDGETNDQQAITQAIPKASNGKHATPRVKARVATMPPTVVTSTYHSLLEDSPVTTNGFPPNIPMCLDADTHHLLDNGTGYEVLAVDGSPLIVPNGNTYRDWSAYTRGQELERHTFGAILGDLCRTIPERDQSMGRRAWPWDKVVRNICRKIFLTTAWRRSVSTSQLSSIEGMERQDPSWSILARYMQSRELTGVLTSLIEESAAPFRAVEDVLAVDSTGFSTSVKQSWNEYRYGNTVRSEGDDDHERLRRAPTTITRFVKAHIASGVRSNVVTAAIVTAEESGDAPQLPALLEKTAQRFRLKQVLADKAYLAGYNLDAVHGLGAVPLIPMKSNSRLHEGTDESTKNWNALYHFFGWHRDTFLAHYHQRSNVETTMSMVKAKFSEHVRSRHEVARVNEVLAKILCHNICQLNRLTVEWGQSFSWT